VGSLFETPIDALQGSADDPEHPEREDPECSDEGPKQNWNVVQSV
jgi:hypothetical protein